MDCGEGSTAKEELQAAPCGGSILIHLGNEEIFREVQLDLLYSKTIIIANRVAVADTPTVLHSSYLVTANSNSSAGIRIQHLAFCFDRLPGLTSGSLSPT